MSILLTLSFNITFFVGEDRAWCFFCVLFASSSDELLPLEDSGFLFTGAFFNDGPVCLPVVFGSSSEELSLSELELSFLTFFTFATFFLLDTGFFGEMFKFVPVFILLEELLLSLSEDLSLTFLFTGDCTTGFPDLSSSDEESLSVSAFFPRTKTGGFLLDTFSSSASEEESELSLVVESFLRELC